MMQKSRKRNFNSKPKSKSNGVNMENNDEEGSPKEKKVYLDYNATTPLEPSVLDAIYASLKYAWGNPSSSYAQGKMAKRIVNESRQHVATMINANANDIIFTSGGTEANNMVFHSVIREFQNNNKNKTTEVLKNGLKETRPHIITTVIEHDSVILALRALEKGGDICLTVLPVSTRTGQVLVSDVANAVQRRTVLVSIMLANNETGVLQPVQEISSAISKINQSRVKEGLEKILVHTDAAQAIGKIEVDANALDVDYLTIVGHKFYAPRIGALYVRDLSAPGSPPLHAMLFGGGQERNYRPGTENTGLIAGLGEACRLVIENVSQYSKKMKDTRDYLEYRLSEVFGDKVHFNCKFENVERLPNTCNMSILGHNLEGRKILLNTERLEASVGAACHSDAGNKPSHILISCGIPDYIARNALRLSVGRYTTVDDIDIVIEELKNAVDKLESQR